MDTVPINELFSIFLRKVAEQHFADTHGKHNSSQALHSTYTRYVSSKKKASYPGTPNKAHDLFKGEMNHSEITIVLLSESLVPRAAFLE